jgi:hypothetical protein
MIEKLFPTGKTFLPFNIGYSPLFAMNDGLEVFVNPLDFRGTT